MNIFENNCNLNKTALSKENLINYHKLKKDGLIFLMKENFRINKWMTEIILKFIEAI
jgi:hypothetical protein